MKGRRGIFAVFAATLVLFAGLAVSFYWSTSVFGGRAPKIVLPSGSPGDPSLPGDGIIGVDDLLPSLTAVAVTPDNVAEVVATLERPAAYAMELVSTLYYAGGESAFKALCYAVDGYTKTELLNDAGMPETHVITGENLVFTWRAGENRYQVGMRGGITPDDAQRIPSYEDILSMQPERILAADFRTYDNQSCVYVEYLDEDTGYTDRYWVSVSTGLLAGAETLDADGRFVYRLEISRLAFEVDGEVFRLADNRMAQEVEREYMTSLAA